MHCRLPDHVYSWPQECNLVLFGCERFCGFCTGFKAFKRWDTVTDLLRHVQTSHTENAVAIFVPAGDTTTATGSRNMEDSLLPAGPVGPAVLDQPGIPLTRSASSPPAEPRDERGRVKKWPDEGDLNIESWESFCQYCPSALAQKEWKNHSRLKKHVLVCHARDGRDHPAVNVLVMKRGAPQGPRGPNKPKTGGRQYQWQQSQGPANVARGNAIETVPRPVPSTGTAPHYSIISDSDLDIMEDIHEQLHLRQGVFGSFFLLVWHHILRLNIPELELLSRTVYPRMGTTPAAVVPILTSFLGEYGPLLWPMSTRSHLVKTSRLCVAGYWTHVDGPSIMDGPRYTIHSRPSSVWQNAFRQSHGRDPNNVEMIFHSPLCQLLSVYVLAALHYSLVDGSYMGAVESDPRVSLHLILVEDEDAPTEPTMMRVKPYIEGTGPIADALIAEAGKPWDSEEVLLSRAKTLFLQTGGLGGLSIVQDRAEEMVESMMVESEERCRLQFLTILAQG